MSAQSDRNLLFSLIAFQNGYINTKQFFKATGIWIKDPGQDIGRILVDLQFISENEYETIRNAIEHRIRRLGGIDASLDFILQSGIVPAPESLPKDWQERIDIQTKTLVKRGDLPSSKKGPWAPTTGLTRYEIGAVIGIGGQGIVFEATDRELKRRVALKRVKPELVSDPEMAQRLIEEAQLASRFDHGGIAPVYDIGADDEGNPFFVMQLIRGEKLSDQTDSINYKSESQDQFVIEIRPLVRRMIDVCNTLQYAYDKFGIIHQDLKPQNIMVDRYGETIVMDWGMGKRVQLVEGASIQLPISSNLDSNGNERGGSGTPGFLSPEQAQSVSNLDHRTDVWGLGATLYKIATGQPANRGRDIFELLDNARKNVYLRPAEINPLIPKELEAICLKAMASEPQNRYQNATDMALDLENWIAGEPVSALPEGRVKKAERFLRRHSRAAITSILVMGLGLAGLLGAYLSVRSAWGQTLESRKMVSTILERIVGDTLDDGLSEVPDADKARVGILSKVAAEMEQVLQKHPEDNNLKLDYLNILTRLGAVQNQTSANDAGMTWSKANELVTAYEMHSPKDSMEERWAMAIVDMRKYFVAHLLATDEREKAKLQNDKARLSIDKLYQRNLSESSIATSYAFVHLQRIGILRSDGKNEDNSAIENEFRLIESALNPFYDKLTTLDESQINTPSAHGSILSAISVLIEKANWYADSNRIEDRNATWLKILEASKLASKIPKARTDGFEFEMLAYQVLHDICAKNQDLANANSYLEQAIERQSSVVQTENNASILLLLCAEHVRTFAQTDRDSAHVAISKAITILLDDELKFEQNDRLQLEFCVALAQLALAKAEGDQNDIDSKQTKLQELRETLQKQLPDSPLLDEL
ncbi:MAG: hypothetical protein RJB11_16 [Planctomycetota bacterium]